MAIPSDVCPTCHGCHHSGCGCDNNGTADKADACARYEHRLQWLARQLEAIRRAELTTRLLLVMGAISLVIPLAAWIAVNKGDVVYAQPQVPGMKVLTVSTVKGATIR